MMKPTESLLERIKLNIDTCKRLIAGLLAACMLLDPLTVIAYAIEDDPTATPFTLELVDSNQPNSATNPYLLYGEEGLRKLAYNMSVQGYYTVGKYFRLEKAQETGDAPTPMLMANALYSALTLLSGKQEDIQQEAEESNLPADTIADAGTDLEAENIVDEVADLEQNDADLPSDNAVMAAEAANSADQLTEEVEVPETSEASEVPETQDAEPPAEAERQESDTTVNENEEALQPQNDIGESGPEKASVDSYRDYIGEFNLDPDTPINTLLDDPVLEQELPAEEFAVIQTIRVSFANASLGAVFTALDADIYISDLTENYLVLGDHTDPTCYFYGQMDFNGLTVVTMHPLFDAVSNGAKLCDGSADHSAKIFVYDSFEEGDGERSLQQSWGGLVNYVIAGEIGAHGIASDTVTFERIVLTALLSRRPETESIEEPEEPTEPEEPEEPAEPTEPEETIEYPDWLLDMY